MKNLAIIVANKNNMENPTLVGILDRDASLPDAN
jgi:hypothetical protein